MLSVISVNYNSSALLKDCLSSISSAVQNGMPVEFIVVDSGSGADDVDALKRLEKKNLKLILSRENIGYAGAVNKGILNATGNFILITNPDVFYKPDSIKNMINALKQLPACGAVGPKTWWDKKMTFLLPLSEILTPYRIIKTELMKVSGTFRDMAVRRWVKRALNYWLSGRPLRQEMLSGACIMTTREVLDIVGGFDESFPLYFEDTDWCLRVRKAGYHLYMVSGADVVHYYNQSAGQEIGVSQQKFHNSLNIYLSKHFQARSYLISCILSFLKVSRNASERLYNDKGVLVEPPDFTFNDDSGKLFLLSTVESMIPSAGAIAGGNFFKISNELWDCMSEGRYFMRVFDIKQLKNRGAWSWVRGSLNPNDQ